MKTQIKYALTFIASARAFDIGGFLGGLAGNIGNAVQSVNPI